MGKFLQWIMGVFQILKLKIRGVKISGTSYIVRKHFRIIGNGGRIQIDGRYGGYMTRVYDDLCRNRRDAYWLRV